MEAEQEKVQAIEALAVKRYQETVPNQARQLECHARYDPAANRVLVYVGNGRSTRLARSYGVKKGQVWRLIHAAR